MTLLCASLMTNDVENTIIYTYGLFMHLSFFSVKSHLFSIVIVLFSILVLGVDKSLPRRMSGTVFSQCDLAVYFLRGSSS